MAKTHRVSNKRPLAPQRIYRTALELAEEAGVEALSMRKLAANLGVDAMSIYHHVANKQALLMGMFETVLGELELPDAQQLSWQAALRELAVRFYRLAVHYPRVFPHLIASPYATHRELEIHRFIQNILDRAGLQAHDQALATAAIYTYAQGVAGVAINGLALRPLYDPRESAITPESCNASEADFAFSVDLLIAGIEDRARRSPAPYASGDQSGSSEAGT